MTAVKYVRDVERLIEPIFASMLRPTELRSLTFWLERIADGANGRQLPADTAIETNDTWVRWQILDEKGGSGSLRLDGFRVLTAGQIVDFEWAQGDQDGYSYSASDIRLTST